MTFRVLRVLTLGLASLLAACGGGARPAPQQVQHQPADVVVEEFDVSTKDEGVTVYLRNKHRQDYQNPTPARTVLFVHGASYPGHSSFDLPIEGTSWMDWLARRGFDVYSIDMRGYGQSTRPPAMGQPPEANPPLADTTVAVEDLSRVIEFVVSRRNLSSLSLVGWSWGATIAGVYAVDAPNRVDRLVLYAPQWLRDVAAPPAIDPANLGAWRLVEPARARDIWLKAVPESKREAVLPKAWFDQWAAAALASDPEGASRRGVRAPNGVVADALRYWAAGRPRWDPGRLSVPVLVIQGEWDAEAPPAMGLALFSRLVATPAKRYVMLGGATHAALLEKNRQHLYGAVRGFLDENF